MSESQAAAVAAIQAEIATLNTDTTAALAAISAQIAALQGQVTSGATLDPTAIVASLQAIDAQVKAAMPVAPVPAPAPVPTPAPTA